MRIVRTPLIWFTEGEDTQMEDINFLAAMVGWVRNMGENASVPVTVWGLWLDTVVGWRCVVSHFTS